MKKLTLRSLTVFLLAILPASASAQPDRVPAPRMTDKELITAPNKAVVELSACFMREEPRYGAELGDQALMGTIVEVIEKQGDWIKVKSPEPYTAWVEGRGIVMMDDLELANYLEAPKYICTADISHVYEEPSLKSRIISEFVLGDIVRIMYKTVTHTSGRYKGYEEGRAVLTKKFVGVVLPSGRTGYVPAKDVAVFYKWAKDRNARAKDESGIRKDIVETCERFLGVPYMWGGTSIKNVDCSGLSRSVFFANGILLPRNASQQGRIGQELPIYDSKGNLDWSALLPGDLIYWGREATDSTEARATHVGVYIGGGRFIHASFKVRVNSLDRNEADFYDRKLLMARRIIGQQDVPGSGIVSTFLSPSYFPQQ